MFSSKKKIILILLHLFVFNFLFTFRYPPSEAYDQMKLWDEGSFSGNIQDYIRLYYSDPSDEAYYYEWSTLVLGKKFEESYPLVKRNNSRVAQLFYAEPQFRIPYQQIEFEYPPTLILPLLIVRSLSVDYLSFTKILALFLSLSYLLCLFLVFKIWMQIDASLKMKWDRILNLSLLFTALLGQLYVTRLDVLATLMILLSLYSFIQSHYKLSAFWTAIAALTKGFPLLLAPLFALKLIKQKKWKDLTWASFILISILLGINLGMAELTQGAYWDSFKYHADRGIQIESLWALIPFWKNLLFDSIVWVYNSHTCSNVTMQNAGILMTLSKYTGPLLFLTIYLLYAKQLFKKIL